MTREQLQHLLRAAAGNTGERVFIVIGSQAILASHPDAPRILRKSMEGDTYPRDAPEKSDIIDGAIGEGSLFHYQYGYYAHGIGPETACVPEGWKERLVELPVDDENETVGLCLEKHDLAFSKLFAGREQDYDFVVGLLKHRLINRGRIDRLIAKEQRPEVQEKLKRNWTIAKAKCAANPKA